MIHPFIHKVRSRLNLGISLHALTLSLLIGSLLAVIAALVFIFRGYSAPLWIYGFSAGCTLLASLVLWLCKKKSTLQAATYADAHFQLKDALTSALEFDGKSDTVYSIQRAQTEDALTGKDPRSVPVTVPRRLLVPALLSASVATALAFVPPSQDVLDQQAQQQLTTERTEEIKREMESAVEELIKSLSDEEKQAINPEELRQWVKELKQTPDRREALRNYARFEQKLQKTIAKLDQRKEEELLKSAGNMLEKSSEIPVKELGKKLAQKDFNSAAEKLNDFKLRKKTSAKEPHKKIDPNTKKKFQLSEKQKQQLKKRQQQLAKLRQLTKRLAQAARQRNGKSGNSSNSQSNGQSGDDLAAMLESLDDDAQTLEEMLEAMELALENGEECDSAACEECEQCLNEDLDKLRKRLKRMNAKRKARQRMQKLKRALSQAQCYANGQCDKLGLRKANGQKPGFGTDDSQRQQKDPLTDNGNYDRLKGQKGKGRSQTTIESADSGTGVSRNAGVAKQRNFERQMDAFVEREDIPDDMKEGVKEYFKNIHQTKTESP